jgi:hypothetical protein
MGFGFRLGNGPEVMVRPDDAMTTTKPDLPRWLAQGRRSRASMKSATDNPRRAYGQRVPSPRPEDRFAEFAEFAKWRRP